MPWPYEGNFIDKSWPIEEKNFSAAVFAQDAIVGAVIETLEVTGIANNTVVFFSGDNGPAPGQHDMMYFNSQGACERCSSHPPLAVCVLYLAPY